MAKYKSNPSNSFFSNVEDDDVDDEKFLKNSRSATYTGNADYNNLERQKAQILQRQKELENQTLESTERSLYLLRESEDTGIATAEELEKQREQLERADKNLDTINSTLRTTQRKIDGIKSVFGSFKNYLKKKSGSDPLVGSSKSGVTPIDRKSLKDSNEPKAPEPEQAVHPGLKIRNLDRNIPSQSSHLSVNERIEKNLEEMCGTVSSLKSLALEMGNEIEYQNTLIEDITYKAGKAEISIKKQTKDMNKIMSGK